MVVLGFLLLCIFLLVFDLRCIFLFSLRDAGHLALSYLLILHFGEKLLVFELLETGCYFLTLIIFHFSIIIITSCRLPFFINFVLSVLLGAHVIFVLVLEDLFAFDWDS